MKLNILTTKKRPSHRHISVLANKHIPICNYWQEYYCYMNLLFIIRTIIIPQRWFNSQVRFSIHHCVLFLTSLFFFFLNKVSRASAYGVSILSVRSPRCKCRLGYTRERTPVGKVSWPAAPCTSSQPHTSMYLQQQHRCI